MTKQEPDIIYMEGKKRKLLTHPLEAYWNVRRKKPVFTLFSVLCWRGYIATWNITGGQLFLADIKGKLIKPVEKSSRERLLDLFLNWIGKKGIQKNIEVDLSLRELFPDEKSNMKKAIWFTGNLRILGKQEEKSKKNKPGYREEIIITVHKGNVVLQTKENNCSITRNEICRHNLF